jgi:cell division protein FtsQ
MSSTNRRKGNLRPQQQESLPRRVSKRKKTPALPLTKRRSKKPAYSAPPVLVRNGSQIFASQGHPLRKNRRRFDVAVAGIPGAEIRLPALPEIHLGWRILSGFFSAILLGLLYALWTLPQFHVQAAEIEGLKRLNAADINTVLKVADQSIFTVDPIQIKQDMQVAFPEMKAITVEVSLPAAVVISVDERQPVLSWKHGDKEEWVDSNGIVFPPRGDVGPLPVIEGDLPYSTTLSTQSTYGTRFLPADLMQAILTLKTQAPKNTSMVYDLEYGLGWQDPRGWKVYFGNTGGHAGEMEQKLLVYEYMVKSLKQQGITPGLISLEYLHAPYYRVGK